MRLEPSMWDAFATISRREGQSIHSLSTEIDKRRGKTALTSAVRVFVLAYFQNLAIDLEARLRDGQPVASRTAARTKGASGAEAILDMIFGSR